MLSTKWRPASSRLSAILTATSYVSSRILHVPSLNRSDELFVPNWFCIHRLALRIYTATPGPRVARPLLLSGARARRPRTRIWRAAHPRTHGIPPTRAHTHYIPKYVLSPTVLILLLIHACLAHVVPNRPRRPVQGYEDEE